MPSELTKIKERISEVLEQPKSSWIGNVLHVVFYKKDLDKRLRPVLKEFKEKIKIDVLPGKTRRDYTLILRPKLDLVQGRCLNLAVIACTALLMLLPLQVRADFELEYFEITEGRVAFTFYRDAGKKNRDGRRQIP